MRDLLWRCDEHRGPDADFPALRGSRERRRSGARRDAAGDRSAALAAHSRARPRVLRRPSMSPIAGLTRTPATSARCLRSGAGCMPADTAPVRALRFGQSDRAAGLAPDDPDRGIGLVRLGVGGWANAIARAGRFGAAPFAASRAASWLVQNPATHRQPRLAWPGAGPQRPLTAGARSRLTRLKRPRLRRCCLDGPPATRRLCRADACGRKACHAPPVRCARSSQPVGASGGGQPMKAEAG